MNKTIGLSGLVGIMTALNVGCGAQKHNTGRLDEKAGKVALSGEPSQADSESSQAQAPASQAQAPASQAQAPASQAQAPASQAQAPASQAQAPASQAQAPASQAQAPASQAQAPASQAQAPASQAQAPNMQAPSPFAQEQALPYEQVWQQESQAQAQSLPALPTQVSPWDAAQEPTSAQLASGALADQQSAAGEQSGAGAQLEPLTRDQAFDRVNQVFATEGRDGVLALTQEKLDSVEKELATFDAQESVQFKQKIDQTRSQWQALGQVSDNLEFVERAADLLSDLSDLAETMASSSSYAHRD